MNTYKLLAAAVVALLAFGAFPASAQTTQSTFGSQIKLGDADFVPTAFGANTVLAAANVLEVDLGTPLEVQDNCFVYDADASGTVSNFDVLLNTCASQNKAAGVLIADGDTVLKTGGLVASGFVGTARFADVNQNGRYDMGDYVYLTTAAAPGIVASTANGAWTIRLTPTGANHGSKAAGTLVAAGDADLIAFAGAAVITGGASGITFFDANLNGALDTGDSVWLARVATGAGVLIPLYSVRLVSPLGAFGTQVKLGDADFAPTSAAASIALAAANVLEVDLGTPLEVQDNCFVYDADASGTVSNFDVLLNTCASQNKAPGTLIADGDTVLKTGGLVASGYTATERFADVNQNGRYDMGDYVYLTTAAAPGIVASTANGAWTLRLTPTGANHGSKAAGTLVAAGDADLIAFAGAAVITGGTSAIAFFDANLNGALDTGDSVYLSRIAIAGAGVLFPLYSVRLVGASGAFGTQLKLGDRDFVPTSAGAVTVLAAANVLEVDLGTPLEVQDNCFVYDADASGTVSNFDLLLNSCQSKAAGVLIADADTVLKTGGLVASGFVGTARFADVNQNGRYDMGDYVYLTTAAAPGIVASTANGAWTIRLTPTGANHGSKAAGTLVAAGDADLIAFAGAAVITGGASGIGFFDANLNGALDLGDSVILSRVAFGAPALFPLYSIRLTGPIATSGSGTGTTDSGSSSSSASSSSSSSASSSSSSSASSSSSSQPPASSSSSSSSSPTKTPGFELVALVAALGAALVMVRRKL